MADTNKKKKDKPQGLTSFKDAQERLRKIIDWNPNTPMHKRRKELERHLTKQDD